MWGPQDGRGLLSSFPKSSQAEQDTAYAVSIIKTCACDPHSDGAAEQRPYSPRGVLLQTGNCNLLFRNVYGSSSTASRIGYCPSPPT